MLKIDVKIQGKKESPVTMVYNTTETISELAQRWADKLDVPRDAFEPFLWLIKRSRKKTARSVAGSALVSSVAAQHRRILTMETKPEVTQISQLTESGTLFCIQAKGVYWHNKDNVWYFTAPDGTTHTSRRRYDAIMEHRMLLQAQ